MVYNSFIKKLLRWRAFSWKAHCSHSTYCSRTHCKMGTLKHISRVRAHFNANETCPNSKRWEVRSLRSHILSEICPSFVLSKPKKFFFQSLGNLCYNPLDNEKWRLILCDRTYCPKNPRCKNISHEYSQNLF